jgi:hypothetical protein
LFYIGFNPPLDARFTGMGMTMATLRIESAGCFAPIMNQFCIPCRLGCQGESQNPDPVRARTATLTRGAAVARVESLRIRQMKTSTGTIDRPIRITEIIGPDG